MRALDAIACAGISSSGVAPSAQNRHWRPQCGHDAGYSRHAEEMCQKAAAFLRGELPPQPAIAPDAPSLGPAPPTPRSLRHLAPTLYMQDVERARRGEDWRGRAVQCDGVLPSRGHILECIASIRSPATTGVAQSDVAVAVAAGRVASRVATKAALRQVYEQVAPSDGPYRLACSQ